MPDAVADAHRISSLEALSEIYGEPLGRAVTKEIGYISDHYRAFIDQSPFMILSTVGPEGTDSSPRGDPAGAIGAAGVDVGVGCETEGRASQCAL